MSRERPTLPLSTGPVQRYEVRVDSSPEDVSSPEHTSLPALRGSDCKGKMPTDMWHLGCVRTDPSSDPFSRRYASRPWLPANLA